MNIRPRVFSPTGTLIGAPVAIASIPRTSPSVDPMAIHLTISSPRCCETSTTSSFPSLVGTLIASLISGRLPSVNLISRTAPIIWVILPILFAMLISPCYFIFYSLIRRLRAYISAFMQAHADIFHLILNLLI